VSLTVRRGGCDVPTRLAVEPDGRRAHEPLRIHQVRSNSADLRHAGADDTRAATHAVDILQ
jgi:hypothetical protein